MCGFVFLTGLNIRSNVEFYVLVRTHLRGFEMLLSYLINKGKKRKKIKEKKRN